MAVVVDPGGSGSVMTPRGKCVLTLRVLEEEEEEEEEGGEGRRRRTVAQVLSDRDGSVLHCFGKGATLAEGAVVEGGQGQGQGHEWVFQNMRIAFDPGAWELSVSVTNSRSVSCFSSIHGGKLVKGTVFIAALLFSSWG
jgi:hypothetical protein